MPTMASVAPIAHMAPSSRPTQMQTLLCKQAFKYTQSYDVCMFCTNCMHAGSCACTFLPWHPWHPWHPWRHPHAQSKCMQTGIQIQSKPCSSAHADMFNEYIGQTFLGVGSLCSCMKTLVRLACRIFSFSNPYMCMCMCRHDLRALAVLAAYFHSPVSRPLAVLAAYSPMAFSSVESACSACRM